MVFYKGCMLVTGGSGFIGSHTVHTLLEGGYQVHATTRSLRSDSLVPLKKLSVKYGQDALKLFEADLLEKGAFNEAMDGVDAVFHVATPVMINISPTEPNQQIKPNVEGTENVFNTCLNYPRVKTIIVTSSTCTIGDFTKESKYIFTEKDRVSNYEAIKFPYIRAKVLAERFIWKFQKKHKGKFRIVTLHPSFMLGPELVFEVDGNNSTNFGKETILELCNSEFKYHFEVDVRDVAKAHLLALETLSATGRFIIYSQTVTISHIRSIVTPLLINYRHSAPSFQLKSGPRFQACYFDNTKSRTILKMDYREPDVTITEFASQIGGTQQTIL